MNESSVAMPSADERARLAGVSAGSPVARQTALVLLVLLGISCGIVVAVVVSGGFAVQDFGAHERLGFGFAWRLAPVFGAAALWAALTGYALVLVMRLSAPATSGRLGRAWIWPPLIMLVAVVGLHAYFWEHLTRFVQEERDWAIAIWLAPTLLIVILLLQLLRMAVVAGKSVARPRGLRLLLVTAIVETLAFLLTNGVFIFFLIYGIGYAASDHD